MHIQPRSQHCHQADSAARHLGEGRNIGYTMVYQHVWPFYAEHDDQWIRKYPLRDNCHAFFNHESRKKTWALCTGHWSYWVWRLALRTFVSLSKDPAQKSEVWQSARKFQIRGMTCCHSATLQRVAALHSIHSADMLDADFQYLQWDLLFHRQLECSSKSARPTSDWTILKHCWNILKLNILTVKRLWKMRISGSTMIW